MKRLTLTLFAVLACAATWAQEIPAYYFENGYLEGKIEKIKKNIESTQEGVTFPYLTDGHWRDNGKQSFPLIKHIGEQVNLPFTVYGGDNIFAFGTKESAMEEAEYYLKAMRDYGKVFGVKGNHDITIRNGWHDEGGYTATQKEIYDYTTSPIANLVKGVEGECYYYWDDKKQGVRYIVLDLFENINTSISWGVNYGFSQKQADWLVNKALKCKGKTIVVFTHAPIDPKMGGVKEMNFLHELLIAMQNGEKFSHNEGLKIEADFTKCNNTVACIVSGHAHRDESHFERGVLSIGTICDAWYNDDPKFKHLPRQRGTTNEQAFDIMTINTATKRIHAVRIGQGKDREWSYSEEFGGEILEQSAASFQGGDLTSFSYWVMKNITYPQKAIKKNIQGRVVLSFVVDKDGTLPTKDIKVLKTPHPMLSNEVKRVIYSSPEWTPGTINEHPVRIKYTLPIMFKFQ
ncbi:MAG: energy transducer TonB [Alistipes sp.]|nr:energy transducer TonB [Alistipes sp.]